jgi:hypothetical protein
MKKRWNIYYTFALLFLAFMMMGNRPSCDRRQPTLECSDMSINVAPGTCVDISNPCDASGDFSRVDGFRLCDGPDGIFVRTNRTRSGTTRQICAASNVAALTNEPVSFIYAAPRELGEGVITITTTGVGGLGVAVSASAASVAAGDPVDLTSVVSNGTAPFSYFWSSNPVGQINPVDTVLANPTVNPTVSVTYTLIVLDNDGATAIDSVSVSVGLGLVVSPDATINVSGSAQLTATASGGDGNYFYLWSPAGSLDDASIADPLASPSTTTTYTVMVVDGAGATATGQVTVNVQLEAVASATPDTIDAGQSSTLDVTAAGGDGNYSYAWAAADGLNPADTNSQSPVVSPSATTTYDVTVTDGTEASVIASVVVTVNAAGAGPVARITSDIIPTLGVQVTFNSSTSTPSPGETITCVSWITLVRDDVGEPLRPGFSAASCSPGDPDFHNFGYFFDGEGVETHIILEITDSSGATDTVTQIYDF